VSLTYATLCLALFGMSLLALSSFLLRRLAAAYRERPDIDCVWLLISAAEKVPRTGTARHLAFLEVFLFLSYNLLALWGPVVMALTPWLWPSLKGPGWTLIAHATILIVATFFALSSLISYTRTLRAAWRRNACPTPDQTSPSLA